MDNEDEQIFIYLMGSKFLKKWQKALFGAALQ